MTRFALTSLAALLAACSSAASISTPVISELTLSASVAPGGTETATFYISNAAGFDGLTLNLTLTEPSGAIAPTMPSPLTASGAPDTMQAAGGFEIPIPAGTAVGTYTVKITVSDGSETSNALTGTFTVS
jgi:hypothetical protein